MRRRQRRVRGSRTVDRALELLPADTAVELSDTSLLVELDRNRVFVITEEACESGRKGIFLD
jgi:hypothetical protein